MQLAALLIVPLFAFTPSARAQCTESQFLPTAAGANRIGTSLAIDGDLALVSESQWGPNFNTPDHVRVHERVAGTWSVTGDLPRPVNFGHNDRFGVRVALSGETAAVLLQRGFSVSEVHIFTRSQGSWRPEQVVIPNPSQLLDGLALEGDRLAVGSRVASALLGEVYVYERTGNSWSLDQTVTPTTDPGADFLGFGQSIELSGDRMVVGTFPLGAAFQSGAAYVMERTAGGWVEAAFLVPPSLSLADRFGMDVAIDGDWVFVGAERDTLPGSNTGAVHVFRRTASGWTFAQSLPNLAYLPQNGGLFGVEMGARVDVSAGRAVASLHRAPTTLRGGGVQTWELVQGSWVASGIVRPADPQPSDGFGHELALAGDRLLTSRTAAATTSAAFLFEGVSSCTYPIALGGPVCSPAVTNSTGLSARISAQGHPAASSGLLTLRADDVPPFTFGYFLTSQSAGSQMPPGSQGFLRLGGNIGRFSSFVQSSGNNGVFFLPVGLTDLPTTPSQPALSGETWLFQAWFRDANPTTTSNLSDAVGITFL